MKTCFLLPASHHSLPTFCNVSQKNGTQSPPMRQDSSNSRDIQEDSSKAKPGVGSHSKRPGVTIEAVENAPAGKAKSDNLTSPVRALCAPPPITAEVAPIVAVDADGNASRNSTNSRGGIKWDNDSIRKSIEESDQRRRKEEQRLTDDIEDGNETGNWSPASHSLVFSDFDGKLVDKLSQGNASPGSALQSLQEDFSASDASAGHKGDPKNMKNSSFGEGASTRRSSVLSFVTESVAPMFQRRRNELGLKHPGPKSKSGMFAWLREKSIGPSQNFNNKGRDDGSREVPEELSSAILSGLATRMKWHNSLRTYLFALAVIMTCSIFCVVYPTKKIGVFVNSAATLNHASRRRYLVTNLIFLTRELVLDDGFSRLRNDQLTSAISYYLQSYQDSDEAVRMGNKLGVAQGADDRNADHNEIMYLPGCKWRGDNSSVCTIPSAPNIGTGGLNEIGQYFADSVKKVCGISQVPSEHSRGWGGMHLALWPRNLFLSFCKNLISTCCLEPPSPESQTLQPD